MKNIISIDATNSCNCDLISICNDGTNTLFIKIKSDLSKNPILEIANQAIVISESDYVHEISSDIFIGTGAINFRIVDDDHTGDYFQITKIESLSGSLSIQQVSNFVYKLLEIVQNTTGVPIATTERVGVVKVGATLNIRSDGTLNATAGEGMTPLTNLELDSLLT